MIVICGSRFDDNIPAWIRITEEYGRGFQEVERREQILKSNREMRDWYKKNPDEYDNEARVAAAQLRNKVAPNWSEEEDMILRSLYGDYTVQDVADEIGRSKNACRQRALKLGIAPPSRGVRRKSLHPTTVSENPTVDIEEDFEEVVDVKEGFGTPRIDSFAWDKIDRDTSRFGRRVGRGRTKRGINFEGEYDLV
jgi:hypothetical protein